MSLAHHTTRRKSTAQPLDEDGSPVDLATKPTGPFTWCRLQISVTMTPPKTGQVFSLDRGPRTYRLLIWAPRTVVLAVTLALLTSHPWFALALAWVRKTF